jgi:hypothetical protein
VPPESVCKFKHLAENYVDARVSHDLHATIVHELLCLVVSFGLLNSEFHSHFVLLDGFLMGTVEEMEQERSCGGDCTTYDCAGNVEGHSGLRVEELLVRLAFGEMISTQPDQLLFWFVLLGARNSDDAASLFLEDTKK